MLTITVMVDLSAAELRVLECALHMLRNDGAKLPATERELGDLAHKIRMAAEDLKEITQEE